MKLSYHRRNPIPFPVILLASLCFALPGAVGAEDGARPQMVDLWKPGDSGERMNIRGRVTSIDGEPIVGARIAIRQADGNGVYHEQYSGIILSSDKGTYQFGSVVPGNYTGQRHVHIDVYHEEYQYYNAEIHFKDDPNLVNETDPHAVFLEEGNAGGEKMMFGRYDITLVPR